MQKRTWLCAAICALVALSGPVAALSFSEISTALAAGNGAGALTLIDAALRQSGLDSVDRARLLVDRGFAHQLQGDSQTALTDLTQAIDANSLTNSEQSRAYLERGLILDSLNRLDDAIRDYGSVLRLDPASATALNNRANVYRRQNRLEDARRDYLASLAADNPAPEYPYYGLGEIAEKEGKPEEARSFYTRAVAANRGYSLAADRLKALGGARAQAPAQAVVLQPPRSASTENAPVILPPPAPQVATAAPPTIKSPGRDARPGLRATLDNSQGGPKGGQVQLGAWREEAAAKQGWSQAVKDAGGALSGFSPHIAAVDLPGKGRYYRLRIETQDGKRLCAVLVAKGLTCIPAGS